MPTETTDFSIMSQVKNWNLENYGQMANAQFTSQGTMVAFPLAFPQTTAMIPIDESRITALSMGSRGFVYGGTSGFRAHLFVGMFHGLSGAVIDLGAIDGAEETVAVCCGANKVAVFTNGPQGGCLTLRENEPINFDLIQEWVFIPRPLEYLGEVIPGERLVHAIAVNEGRQVIGATEQHLFAFDFDSQQVNVIGECRTLGRIVVGPSGAVYGRDDNNALWQLDLADMKLTRNAIVLPEGHWDGVALVWGTDPNNGTLYTADAEGVLYAMGRDGAFSTPRGQTMHAPVTSLAVTLDGRLYGTCGEGISKVFCLHPTTGQVDNVGVAVSTIHRRRYGYQFADAVVGRDGQVFFGENDNLGHLWIYFPRIERPQVRS